MRYIPAKVFTISILSHVLERPAGSSSPVRSSLAKRASQMFFCPAGMKDCVPFQPAQSDFIK